MGTDSHPTNSVRDVVEPSGRWEFDASVTRAFDDMLERSIPNYHDMRQLVTKAAVWHADRASADSSTPLIVDLGASRGAALQPIVSALGSRADYLACDVSEPMLEACSQRFSEGEASVEVLRHDLRDGYPTGRRPATAVLSVLTMQFVPMEYRQRLLCEIHGAIEPAGVFVLVEKVLGATAEMDEFLTDSYYDLKREHGYSQEAIDRKRLSLEGVLVPLPASFNESLMTMAGFRHVDCCWAWANFRAWIARP
jgi:tRNA (cmo5U34)-methyltransferase